MKLRTVVGVTAVVCGTVHGFWSVAGGSGGAGAGSGCGASGWGCELGAVVVAGRPLTRVRAGLRQGVLYVGGEFTSVRPPGDPQGTGEVAADLPGGVQLHHRAR